MKTIWKGVSMKPTSLSGIMSMLAVFLFTGCSVTDYPSLVTLCRDSQAAQLVKNEKFDEALTKYYSLLESASDSSVLHSNIGILLDKAQKKDEALKSLNYALKLAETQIDKRSLFKIRYNLGVYFGQQKMLPQALENYQAALEITPDSLETKTNIELLIQQQNQQQSGNQGDKKDQKDQSKNDENKDQNKDQNDENNDNKEDQKKQSSPKYQPRPFKGDELSEADVKKILGELRNQEQKIRANFDKKEKKGKANKNEKDW